MKRKPAVGKLYRFILFCILFIPLSSLAQTHSISGKVTDSAGAPLEHATVAIKGSKGGTATAADGSFTLAAGNSAVLVVSSVGYTSREIPAGHQSNLIITLARANDALSAARHRSEDRCRNRPRGNRCQQQSRLALGAPSG